MQDCWYSTTQNGWTQIQSLGYPWSDLVPLPAMWDITGGAELQQAEPFSWSPASRCKQRYTAKYIFPQGGRGGTCRQPSTPGCCLNQVMPLILFKYLFAKCFFFKINICVKQPKFRMPKSFAEGLKTKEVGIMISEALFYLRLSLSLPH